MNNKKQITQDLERHFSHRLQLWIRDCAEVCRVAEIRAGETIMLILLKVTIRTLQSAMAKSEFLAIMSDAYDLAAIDNAEADRAEQKTGRQL